MKSRRIRLGALVVGILSIVAATSTFTIAGPSTQAARPVLPPPHVLEPSLFDRNDCQMMPISEAADAPWEAFCGPGEANETPSEVDPSSWQSLRGFVGPRFTTELAGGRAVLLPETVTISDSGQWRAWCRRTVKNVGPRTTKRVGRCQGKSSI